DAAWPERPPHKATPNGPLRWWTCCGRGQPRSGPASGCCSSRCTRRWHRPNAPAGRWLCCGPIPSEPARRGAAGSWGRGRRRWPPGLAGAVLAAIDVAVRAGAPSGRLIALCALAATSLPVSAVSAVSVDTLDTVGTVEALWDRLAAERPDDSRLPVIELLANTL